MTTLPSTWREPLVVATLLTILGLLFVSARLDGGRLARQTLFWSGLLWVGIAVVVAVRRNPSRPERILVALAPLTIVLTLLTTEWLAR